MVFLICIVAVCPVRAEPLHRSEQTSQLLFGEKCELLETKNEFARVKVLFDNYEGWCQSAQLAETQFATTAANKLLAAEWLNQISINERKMYIPFGSSLTFLNVEKNISEQYKIVYKGAAIEPEKSIINDKLIKKYACTFLNSPYLWGGRSVFGIDCSGFTQLVFKCINISLLRDAYQQATQGKVIESLSEARCGDVAFFNNEAGKITHTGIMLSSNTIIHASGKVRIDAIDNMGIINNDTGKRTHNLKIIRRFIN